MSYSQTDITKVEEDAPSELLSFFLPGAVDAALKDCGFSVGEEVELIIQMIRDAPNIHTRLAALKYWNQRSREILETSGHIQKMTAQITGGTPNQALLIAQTTRLLEVGHTNSNIGVDHGKEPNEPKEDHDETPEIIDVEPSEPETGDDTPEGPGPDSGAPFNEASDDSSDEPITCDGDAGTFTRTGHFPPETSKRGLSGR